MFLLESIARGRPAALNTRDETLTSVRSGVSCACQRPGFAPRVMHPKLSKGKIPRCEQVRCPPRPHLPCPSLRGRSSRCLIPERYPSRASLFVRLSRRGGGLAGRIAEGRAFQRRGTVRSLFTCP